MLAEILQEGNERLAMEACQIHHVRAEGMAGRAEAGDIATLRFIQENAVQRVGLDEALCFAEEPAAKRLLVDAGQVMMEAVAVHYTGFGMAEGVPAWDKMRPVEDAPIAGKARVDAQTQGAGQVQAPSEVAWPAVHIFFMNGEENGSGAALLDFPEVVFQVSGVPERIVIGDDAFHTVPIIPASSLSGKGMGTLPPGKTVTPVQI